jgi:hypothetical protein
VDLDSGQRDLDRRMNPSCGLPHGIKERNELVPAPPAEWVPHPAKAGVKAKGGLKKAARRITQAELIPDFELEFAGVGGAGQ